MATATAVKTGKVVQVIGPVVDVEFAGGELFDGAPRVEVCAANAARIASIRGESSRLRVRVSLLFQIHLREPEISQTGVRVFGAEHLPLLRDDLHVLAFRVAKVTERIFDGSHVMPGLQRLRVIVAEQSPPRHVPPLPDARRPCPHLEPYP